MTNPVLALITKYAGPHWRPQITDVARRVHVHIKGLAQDFWKDGCENPFTDFLDRLRQRRPSPFMEEMQQSDRRDSEQLGEKNHRVTAPIAAGRPASNQWHAEAGEVAETMWGKECILPGDEVVSEWLIKPLALQRQQSVLDLSAGLGRRARKLVDEEGVYVTGLEPDPEIALRGMDLSIKDTKGKAAAISSYDPARFPMSKSYDALIMREIFYGVEHKDAFSRDLARCMRDKAHVSFIDYIIDPENIQNPAIVTWQKYEPSAKPLSLLAMMDMWTKAGVTLIEQDEITAYYKKEILLGMKRLATYLASGARPDAPTRLTLSRQLELWAQRAKALERGLHVFRFHGFKQG